MAKLEFLIIHCTATPVGRSVTSKDIRKWHMSPPPTGRGWSQVGYSDIIHTNGVVENLVPHDGDDIVQPREITNGAVGMNSKSRHVVYVGGLDEDARHAIDTRTPEQRFAMANYIRQTIAQHPNIKVAGHNQFALKECPSFDVRVWAKGVGIPEKNIYMLDPNKPV